MEFSRPEYWHGSPFSSPGDLPNRGIEPRSPTVQVDSLPAEPQGKPKNTGVDSLSLLQQIFPTQELNQGLLHWRWILYQLSYWRQICQRVKQSSLSCLLPSGHLTRGRWEQPVVWRNVSTSGSFSWIFENKVLSQVLQQGLECWPSKLEESRGIGSETPSLNWNSQLGRPLCLLSKVGVDLLEAWSTEVIVCFFIFTPRLWENEVGRGTDQGNDCNHFSRREILLDQRILNLWWLKGKGWNEFT